MKIKHASTVALIALVSLCPASFGADILDLLRNYIGSSGSGAASNQNLIKTNINTRQAQLETEIQAGVNSGQLTPQEETDLRIELNRIGNLEGTYLADGTLSNWEIQNLLDEMMNFSRRLQTYISNTTTTATATPRNWYRQYRGRSGDDAVSNQTRLQASIDTKQAELDSMIEQGLSSGRLNWTDGRRLQTELNTIASDEYRYMSDARLSWREADDLTRKLEALEVKLKAELDRGWGNRGRRRGRGGRGDWGSVDSRQSILRQRIERGVASGKITRFEAARLNRDEERIRTLEAQLRGTGARLSYSEERRLLQELDDLSRKIDRELHDRQVE